MNFTYKSLVCRDDSTGIECHFVNGEVFFFLKSSSTFPAGEYSRIHSEHLQQIVSLLAERKGINLRVLDTTALTNNRIQGLVGMAIFFKGGTALLGYIPGRVNSCHLENVFDSFPLLPLVVTEDGIEVNPIHATRILGDPARN